MPLSATFDHGDLQQALPYDMIVAQHRCRLVLGYLGLALPGLLIVLGAMVEIGLRPSVSDYYHSALRDLFVGTLFTTGIVLCTYTDTGDTTALRADWLIPLSGLAAVGVALFPNEGGLGPDSLMISLLGPARAAMGHYICAVLFLAGLAYLCLVRLPKHALAAQRRIYLRCGYVILFGGCLATLASIVKLTGPGAAQDIVIRHNLVFWIEALGIWAFGLSWLLKSRSDMQALRRQFGHPNGLAVRPIAPLQIPM